jgi:hypothetical protein
MEFSVYFPTWLLQCFSSLCNAKNYELLTENNVDNGDKNNGKKFGSWKKYIYKNNFESDSIVEPTSIYCTTVPIKM